MSTKTLSYRLRTAVVAGALVAGAAGGLVLGLGTGAASASGRSMPVTTLKFVAHAKREITTSTSIQASGTLTQKGALIGFYAVSCQPSSSTTLACGFSPSFATGEIFTQVVGTTAATGSTFTGTVEGGTGAYQGATGTLRGTFVNPNTTDETITLS